jgi:hypothetical protein
MVHRRSKGYFSSLGRKRALGFLVGDRVIELTKLIGVSMFAHCSSKVQTT